MSDAEYYRLQTRSTGEALYQVCVFALVIVSLGAILSVAAGIYELAIGHHWGVIPLVGALVAFPFAAITPVAGMAFSRYLAFKTTKTPGPATTSTSATAVGEPAPRTSGRGLGRSS